MHAVVYGMIYMFVNQIKIKHGRHNRAHYIQVAVQIRLCLRPVYEVEDDPSAMSRDWINVESVRTYFENLEEPEMGYNWTRQVCYSNNK